MDSVFKYSDYRKFLQDYYVHKKEQKKSFTYRTISALAGINSSGYYPLIIKGERNLTDATIEKTCRALDLNPQETRYFTALVHFNQATKLKDKNHFFEELISVRNEGDAELIKENQYDIFSEWYHGVIRELVVCREFGGDFRKLGRMLRPEITEKQARESVELLLRLGFLKMEGDRYVQSSSVLKSGPDLKAHQLINYQVKMLRLAIEAFDRFGPADLLSNSSTTFRISERTFELFKQKNRQHREELLQIATGDEMADQVYQLNINLFPLSNPKHRGAVRE